MKKLTGLLMATMALTLLTSPLTLYQADAGMEAKTTMMKATVYIKGYLTAAAADKPFGGDNLGTFKIRLKDDNRVTFIVKLSGPKMMTDKVLEGWLVDSESGYKLSTGQFNEKNMLIFSQRMVNPAIYDMLVITEEPKDDINPSPSTTIGGVQLAEPFGTAKGELPTEMPPAPGARVIAGKVDLDRLNVPLKIPMIQGWYNSSKVYFIATETSDVDVRDRIEAATGFKAVHAPVLADAPVEATANVYIFPKAIEIGPGIMGGQTAVFDSTPNQTADYSPLRKLVEVRWTGAPSQTPLMSVGEIMAGVSAGTLELTETNIVLNLPMIKWPGGQMMVKEPAKTSLDHTPYGGGQILQIAQNNRFATFIAHRGFGSDGQTIYYIVTDATPKGPADMMGVVYAPKTEALALSPAAVDLFQFTNGVEGSGPMGFQPGIGAADVGDENYSPMWRISFITWNDAAKPGLITTMDGITSHKDNIIVELAMDGKHVVNCPFIVEIPRAASTTPQ